MDQKRYYLPYTAKEIEERLKYEIFHLTVERTDAGFKALSTDICKNAFEAASRDCIFSLSGYYSELAKVTALTESLITLAFTKKVNTDMGLGFIAYTLTIAASGEISTFEDPTPIFLAGKNGGKYLSSLGSYEQIKGSELKNDAFLDCFDFDPMNITEEVFDSLVEALQKGIIVRETYSVNILQSYKSTSFTYTNYDYNPASNALEIISDPYYTHINNRAITEGFMLRRWTITRGTKESKLETLNLKTYNLNEPIPESWHNLNNNKNAGVLVPGQKYRIIDYEAHTTEADTARISIGLGIDIVITALTNNTFSDECTILPRNDDYTLWGENNINRWKVWYCFDNDATRFLWADPVNGRGVIYRMIDGNRNIDVPYDFLQIHHRNHITNKMVMLFDIEYSAELKLKQATGAIPTGFFYKNITIKPCWQNDPDRAQELNRVAINYDAFLASGIYISTFIDYGCQNIYLAETFNIRIGQGCRNIFLYYVRHTTLEGNNKELKLQTMENAVVEHDVSGYQLSLEDDAFEKVGVHLVRTYEGGVKYYAPYQLVE